MKIVIKRGDIVFRAYNSGGKGGQHGNRSMNAIEAKHLPTGLTATSSLKSQHRNRKLATRLLLSRVVAYYRRQLDDSREAPPDERVRTYHECDNRVVDHRTGEKWSYADTVGKGKLAEIIESTGQRLAMEGAA